MKLEISKKKKSTRFTYMQNETTYFNQRVKEVITRKLENTMGQMKRER